MPKRFPVTQALRTSEITSKSTYLNRRSLLKGMSAAAGLSLAPWAGANATLADELTPKHLVTGYNNFWEFGKDKGDPAENAHTLTTDPWSVEVTGATHKPGTYAFEDVIKGLVPEERIYRFRCVEAWSMVVPWMGIPLKAILDRFEPTGSAKYVELTTLYRPSEMPGQRSLFSGIDWPYVEGLRLDEAYHPLTIMAVGLYGETLPNQNGAPWRLIVPWKYGFKSVKSVVKIRFTEKEPLNSWQKSQPREYGFYANVNPAVDHPRWSQATERRLTGKLFDTNRIPTLPFNGYAEEVADLYAGMDLARYY